MLEIKLSFFDLNMKFCLPRGLLLNRLEFLGVFNEDIQDSNPHFPNYQIYIYIYIYAWKKWILLFVIVFCQTHFLAMNWEYSHDNRCTFSVLVFIVVLKIV